MTHLEQEAKTHLQSNPWEVVSNVLVMCLAGRFGAGHWGLSTGWEDHPLGHPWTLLLNTHRMAPLPAFPSLSLNRYCLAFFCPNLKLLNFAACKEKQV